MNKTTAQTSIKNLSTEANTLTPSALISLYEIDVTDLAVKELLIKNSKFNKNPDQTVFRFHNNLKLTQSSIFFKDKEYFAAPIHASGFEINSKGTAARPKLQMTISEEGIAVLRFFKDLMQDLEDMVGSKVYRIRTFARFLDAKNFYKVDTNNNIVNDSDGNPIIVNSRVPRNFSPDPNASFPTDLFFIDRKSGENKNSIEFELSSYLDLEQIKLPARIVSSKRCPWTYRGAGCCYEYASDAAGVHEGSILPTQAPPVANELDESIVEILKKQTPQVNYRDVKPEPWTSKSFTAGTPVYITVKGIRYYYVAKTTVPATSPPPNTAYWIADHCSKTITGCRLRWGINSPGQLNSIGRNGYLPFGGFPAISTNY